VSCRRKSPQIRPSPRGSCKLRLLADSLQALDGERRRLLTQRRKTNDASRMHKYEEVELKEALVSFPELSDVCACEPFRLMKTFFVNVLK